MSHRIRSHAAAVLTLGVLTLTHAAAQPAADPPLPDRAEPAAATPAEEPFEAQEAPGLDDPLPKAFAVTAGGLTASEVARRAAGSSPAVKARQAELEAAAARVDAAMIGFLPRLTLSANYTRLSAVGSSLGGGALVGAGNPGLLSTGPCPTGGGTCVLDSAGQPVGAAAFEIKTVVDNYSLRAALSVPLSDYVLKLSQSLDATTQNLRAAELNKQAERRKVEVDAKVTFYNWTRGLGQLAVAEKSLERTQSRLAEARVQYRLGTATQADVLRLDALVAGTEAAIEEAKAFRDIATEQLRVLMRDDRTQLVLGESILDASPRPMVGSPTLATLVAESQSKRLELQALAATRRSIESSATVTRRGRLPRLDGFADYTYANPNSRAFPPGEGWSGSWQAGLNLTWTVNEAFSASASARELDASARQVAQNHRALRDGIRLEVTQAYLELRKAKAAHAAAVRGATASLAAYSVARSLYRFGKATTTELIDAEGELVAAQLRHTNAQIDMLVADVKLRHAVGRDTT